MFLNGFQILAVHIAVIPHKGRLELIADINLHLARIQIVFES